MAIHITWMGIYHIGIGFRILTVANVLLAGLAISVACAVAVDAVDFTETFADATEFNVYVDGGDVALVVTVAALVATVVRGEYAGVVLGVDVVAVVLVVVRVMVEYQATPEER
jgi:hypothetical protein